MEIKGLGRGDLRTIYSSHMEEDFPPKERKPLRVIEALLDAGMYDTLGIYEGETLMAYAFLWHDEERDYVLLDYFAVCAGGRGQGTGTTALGLLEDYYSDYCGILAESEALDDDAAPEENEVRTRRLDFYRRAGFHSLGYRVRLFTVVYEMLSSGKGDPQGALAMHQRMYRHRDAKFKDLVEIPYEKS